MEIDNTIQTFLKGDRMPGKTFTVAFRTGGRENVTWKKTVAFLTRGEAVTAKAGIEKGGRKALLFDTDQLNAIGLPVGWDANDVQS